MEAILFILFWVFWIFFCFIISCWNEKLELWTAIFGNFLGKLLYNFNIETNHKFICFWK